MVKVSMIKKIFSLEILFSIAIAIIGVRLGYVQLLKNNILLNGANDSWQRSFPLVASRGYIYSSDGTALAINIPTMSVAFIPYQVKENTLKVEPGSYDFQIARLRL